MCVCVIEKQFILNHTVWKTEYSHPSLISSFQTSFKGAVHTFLPDYWIDSAANRLIVDLSTVHPAVYDWQVGVEKPS